MPGRQKGAKNRFPIELKDMILGALYDNGGREYLAQQARQNPVAFMSLLAKVLPMQLANADDSKPLRITFEWADAAPTIDHAPSEQQAE